MKLSVDDILKIILPRVHMSGMKTEHWALVIETCASEPGKYVSFFYPTGPKSERHRLNWPRHLGGQLSQAPDYVCLADFEEAAAALSGIKLEEKPTERARILAHLIKYGVAALGEHVRSNRSMADKAVVSKMIGDLDRQEFEEGPLPDVLCIARQGLKDQLTKLVRRDAKKTGRRRCAPSLTSCDASTAPRSRTL